MQCRKCQKEYIPKRAGGLFCKPSCGNSYRQKIQRDEQKKVKLVELGQAVERPLTEEEAQLWGIVFVLAVEAKQILLDNELPADKKPTNIGVRTRTLLVNCQEKGESAMMKSLGIRYQAQLEAKKRAEKALEEQNKSKQQKQTKAEKANNKSKQGHGSANSKSE